LEAKIAKNKNFYYDALNPSQDGWHEGTEDRCIRYMKLKESCGNNEGR